ncbi:MAG: AI-2E family transporter [Pseudomonadota bacterium]
MIILIALMTVGILYSLDGIGEPFFTAFVGAYLFNKIAHRLERYMPRSIASGLIILTFLITLFFVSSIVLPYLQNELISLVKGIPNFAERVMAKIQPLLSSMGGDPLTATNVRGQVSTYLGDIVKWAMHLIMNLLSNGMLLANMLTLAILTPVIMFYMLRDWPKLIHNVNQRLPDNIAPTVRRIFKRIDTTLTHYLIGQSTVCLTVAVLYIVGLSLTGIEKFWFLGIMTGVLTFIPYLGMIIGLCASLSIAFTTFVSWGQIISIILVFFSVSLIEGNVLTPRFVGGRIGLHPVFILFSLLAGGTWFGFSGILFAIPTAAIIGVLIREALGHSTRKNPSAKDLI